jgi:streptogramin lyase
MYRRSACSYRPRVEALEGRCLPSAGVTDFPVPTPGSGPVGITAGPDGNLWFTENATNQIGRITPAGAVREFPIVTSGSDPWGITAGPDGNLWFTEFFGNKIGRMTTGGTLSEFPILTANGNPEGITAGPDGTLWFTEAQGDRIGRVTPSGTVTEFALPAGSRPVAITAGPDGNLWFTEAQGNKVGRMTVAGVLTGEFPLPAAGSAPQGIVAGPDGALWFTESGANRIGRVSPSGALTEFPVPTAGSAPQGIAVGPDGNLWFTESRANQIGRITAGGSVTEFGGLTAPGGPQGIVAAPGALWFAEQDGNRVGEVVLDRPLQVTAMNRGATAGTTFSGVVASFTDADPAGGAGGYAAAIAWGDGQTSAGTVTAEGVGAFTVTGSHSYRSPGAYAIAVTITDIDTGRDIGGSSASGQGAVSVIPLTATIAGPNRGSPRRSMAFTGLWRANSSTDTFTAAWLVTRPGRKARVVARGAGSVLRLRLTETGGYLLTLTVTDQQTGTTATASTALSVHGRPRKG